MHQKWCTFFITKRYTALDPWLFQNLANSLIAIKDEATFDAHGMYYTQMGMHNLYTYQRGVLRCSFYGEWQCESLETAERAWVGFHAFSV